MEGTFDDLPENMRTALFPLINCPKRVKAFRERYKCAVRLLERKGNDVGVCPTCGKKLRVETASAQSVIALLTCVTPMGPAVVQFAKCTEHPEHDQIMFAKFEDVFAAKN